MFRVGLTSSQHAWLAVFRRRASCRFARFNIALQTAARKTVHRTGKTELWKRIFVEQEKWLDNDPAVRHLERPELAKIVVDALGHFDGVRYESIAFVVMPSHIHWLFRPIAEWCATVPAGKSPREVIMHSFKSFTAHECNALLHKTGAFWQDESFDHCVRDENELERIFDYIELNPVKAGLCQYREQWPYSSAYWRPVVESPSGVRKQ